MASAETETMTEDVRLEGTVPEADQEAMTFQIKLPDGTKVRAPISSEHFDNIQRAWNGFLRGMRILLDGVGRYDRLGRLQAIETIERTMLLDPNDVPSRLEQLKALKDGWLDGRGIAPSQAGLEWLAREFDSRYPGLLPPPYIYPVAEGGVRLEWTIGRREISLEVDLGRKSAEWHSLNLETDREECRSVDLGDEAGWAWLVVRLVQLVGADPRD